MRVEGISEYISPFSNRRASAKLAKGNVGVWKVILNIFSYSLRGEPQHKTLKAKSIGNGNSEYIFLFSERRASTKLAKSKSCGRVEGKQRLALIVCKFFRTGKKNILYSTHTQNCSIVKVSTAGVKH